MPVNRNALIRYKTIDKCLQNNYRKWTLEDLIEACSDALYEYEGIDKGVSKRTVQADIQLMRSDKLGYNAPIIVKDKKYYLYEDVDYSITNIPITDQDLQQLNETVKILKQFKGFSHFKELDGMIQKLEDHVYSQKFSQAPVIDFEKNDHLKGLNFLDQLYQSIIHKKTVLLSYQSFKARQSNTFHFHPYLLKEFRNRWFLIGTKRAKGELINLALDRIIAIDKGSIPYHKRKDFDARAHFQDAIGVSVSPNLKPEKVILFVVRKHAPYVLTKPLHHSQKLLSKDYYGITISLEVQHNFELEKEILGFGDGIRVIEPNRLKRNIRDRLSGGLDLYTTVLHENGLLKHVKKLHKHGFSILNNVYTTRELKKMKSVLDRYFTVSNEKAFGKRKLLMDIPELYELVFNKNLKQIVSKIDKAAFLVKAIYFDKTVNTNWFVSWHQDIPINVSERIETDGFRAWTHKQDIYSVRPPEAISKTIFSIRIHLDDTDSSNGALKVIPGSQNKFLSSEEIKIITGNSTPFVSEVGAGGIQLMKPLLLHASSKSSRPKRRRVIHLEFSSEELPGALEWLERMNINN